MNSKFETKKRLTIAKTIGKNIKDIVEGMLLGGSMGFGQNFSVRETSDIDTVIVCDKKKIYELLNTSYFKNQVQPEVIELFVKGKINLFWVTREIDNVEVNFFVYDKESYMDFCLMKGNLKGYVHFKPNEIQTAFGFSGEEIRFNRNVTSFRNGYLYEKPALINGKYWGGVPRQDFFYSGFIICEKENFLTDLEKEVWERTIAKLKEENAGSILNTHFTYNKEPERLPKKFFKNIKERTALELDKISF